MTLLWSPESIHDLLALRAHIAEHDPAAAKRVALHILYCVEYSAVGKSETRRARPRPRHPRKDCTFESASISGGSPGADGKPCRVSRQAD